MRFFATPPPPPPPAALPKHPPRSFRLSNPGDGAHNGNVKRVVDSQRSSFSFGIGRAGFVSANVNLRDWDVKGVEGRGEGGGLISPSFPSCVLPNRASLRPPHRAPSRCADSLCARVIAADRRPWCPKSKHTPEAVRRLLPFARTARAHDNRPSDFWRHA